MQATVQDRYGGPEVLITGGGILTMRLLRELSRRKLRTTLTISGITIGIWALVVFSSMANQINGLVGMGTEFYADKITVTDAVAFGTSPMRLTDADAIASVAGVAAADPRVEVFWESDPAVGFSVPGHDQRTDSGSRRRVRELRAQARHRTNADCR